MAEAGSGGDTRIRIRDDNAGTPLRPIVGRMRYPAIVSRWLRIRARDDRERGHESQSSDGAHLTIVPVISGARYGWQVLLPVETG